MAETNQFRDDYTILLEEKVAKLEAELNNIRNHAPSPHGPGLMRPQPSGNHHQTLSPASMSTPQPPTAPCSTTDANGGQPSSRHAVSILNSDPESGVVAPQSFSVVSSLLQDNFWGRSNAGSAHMQPHQTTVGDSTGLLPDYNFDEYLKSRPIDIPDESTGDTLLENYLKIQGKFSFMDKNSFIKLHQDRHKVPNNLDDPTYRFNSFVLFSIYALSTVLQPPSCVAGKSFLEPHRYYSTALRHARLCKSKNPMWQIKALLICAMYQMRTDIDHGCHFDMVNRCIKLCAEVGLHQSKEFDQLTLYEQEMRKRLFWSVYGLERLYAVSTGRKFGLEEEEILLDFPADLDFDDLTEEKIRQARNSQHETPDVTAVTFTKHIWKLRRLESDMVTAIYRTDRPMQELFSKVDYYLASLKNWREAHKPFTTREENVASIAYAKGVRLLLQPFLASLDPDGPLFKKCVVETGRICGVFRDFYRKAEEGYTTIAMHTNFIAGLTLIYCLWLSKDTNFLPILESIRICTTSLYMLTERSKLCKNYRDTFENLVTATIKHVIENQSGRLQAKPENSASRNQLFSADSSTSIFQNIVPASRQSNLSDIRPIPSVSNNFSNGTPSVMEDVKPDINVLRDNDPMREPPANAANDPSSPIVANTSWAYGAQAILPQVPLPNSTNAPPSREWLDACGYDDTMYNMIQDISSWTKVSGESGYDTQIPDNMWTNLTDFSLT